MVFNTTLNSISVILSHSLLVEETWEINQPVASHWQTLSHKCCIKYTSPWVGFRAYNTDCIVSCKSNYYMPQLVNKMHNFKMWMLKTC
jgi:hypothetical protein